MVLILCLFVCNLLSNIAGAKFEKFRNDYMWADQVQTYYKLHGQPTHWYQAKQSCEDEGTMLLIPDTFNEMDNIKVLMSNMKSEYSAIFVGIHDQYSDGNYVTVRGDHLTGTVQGIMWAEGSPDSYEDNEHCVVMNRLGLLDDRPCTDVYPFICKIAADDFKYHEECDGFDTGYVLQNVSVGQHPKCYKFHREPLSWFEAYATCFREEGELAIINSPEEARVVTNLLRDHINSNVPDPNMLYLGFSDLLFPYQYRTIKDDTLKAAGYSSFHPIKETVVANKTKRCGALSRTGYLILTYCDRPAMFLCQKGIDKNNKLYNNNNESSEESDEYE
ncbi:C-type mannose receptor 2-like [Aricia agestis]|uniref:C-type mannose receptor 2-like n=1 Tax=Aricia agestis TaxID=91739 RepID=UPI001C202AB2|nr:C-type mannose receptor 2-like [Aricia agestis]